MRIEKAPASGAMKITSSPNHKHEPRLSQTLRLVEYAMTHIIFTTLDAREELGILNVAQRVSELRARRVPIERMGMVKRTDRNGVIHRVAQYVWRGAGAWQGDFWGYSHG